MSTRDIPTDKHGALRPYPPSPVLNPRINGTDVCYEKGYEYSSSSATFISAPANVGLVLGLGGYDGDAEWSGFVLGLSFRLAVYLVPPVKEDWPWVGTLGAGAVWY